MTMATDTLKTLTSNSRFYILLSSFLISLLVISDLRLNFASDQLFYIRSEQVFGLLAMVYWYIALIISPLKSVISTHSLRQATFARRAIGVSAAYFVLLHAVIATWGQLGGLGALQYLPTMFKWSLIGGGITAFVLLIMAATSFDSIVKQMTYARWKALHRVGYAAFIIVLLHIWTIGTHTAYSVTQVSVFAALILLAGLELFRLTKAINNKLLLKRLEVVTLYITSLSIVALLIVATPTLVGNYHSQHTSHNTASNQKDQP
jgi:DMSO/TMAO reductase YedYZ heme-binding membrane subunit